MSRCKNYPKEVSIPFPLYESERGRYFIGETPILTGESKNAIVTLSNPCDSNVNLYVNAITVTNISEFNLSAEFYLRSSFNDGNTSDSISCTNLAIVPPPINKGQIKYTDSVCTPPKDGISIFSRIVSPYSTSVIDGGQMIISPGQRLLVYLGGYLPIVFDSVIVAFGWGEEPKNPCCN